MVDGAWLRQIRRCDETPRNRVYMALEGWVFPKTVEEDGGGEEEGRRGGGGGESGVGLSSCGDRGEGGWAGSGDGDGDGDGDGADDEGGGGGGTGSC